MIEFRDPRFNVFGTIDVEINHPDHGWVPFTASPDDPEEFGRELHAEAGKGNVAPYIPPPPSPEPIPDEISDRQFFQQLAVEKRITEAEALAAVATGTIPAAMQALIAQLPADQQFAAKMLVSGATIFRRLHPVADMIRQLYQWTPEQRDAFWLAASKV